MLGPALADRQLDGASSWAAIVACFGVGGVLGNVVALRLPLRRPVFIAALALVGASTQAAIIGSGLGTVGIAGLELLAGICVALFFTLWDLSIQEQVPAHAVSRVSAYDFSVSHGPHAAGDGDGRPDRRRPGPAGDADRDERDRPGGGAGLAGAAVGAPPAPAGVAAPPAVRATPAPAVGAGGRERHA